MIKQSDQGQLEKKKGFISSYRLQCITERCQGGDSSEKLGACAVEECSLLSGSCPASIYSSDSSA